MTTVVAGRYELIREIGRGGMGAVWLGRDRVLRREVALKRLGALPGHDDDTVRVEREARVAAMVNHPNVVGVLDLVEDGAAHWLVMEYVDSETLAQRIRRDGPLTPEELSPILRQAVAALATAHEAGIVHRDVKPSNILLGRDGVVKLGDFGIARASDDDTLTMTGMVTGSPGYMAPEVASGHTAGPAADLWSLGASAFHALTGTPPFHSTSEELMATLYRVVHEEPPRTDRAGWLDPLLRATMHRDPAGRWTAQQALGFLDGGPAAAAAATAALPVVPAVPSPYPGLRAGAGRVGRRRAALAAAVALVALLGAAAWVTGRDDGATPPASAGNPTDRVPVTTEVFEPSAADMEAFVRDYLDEVADQPSVAYARLTPSFQEQSGDYEDYYAWWKGLRKARVVSIQADPEALEVTYEVRYTWAKGQGREKGKLNRDRTTLGLSFDDRTGEYRIASEQG